MGKIPALYVIADAQVLAASGVALQDFARGLRAAGVGFVQYRDKVGSPQEVLRGAAVLREIFAGSSIPILIMNDRADLAALAGFDGVHVGQGDLLPEDAKAVLLRTVPTQRVRQERDECGTQSSGDIVGVSTHTEAQVLVAEASCADYVAIGPVFATGTKADAEAVVGLAGVRRARAQTTKPLVAIGGVTAANARSVIEAGADSVAVISALVSRAVPTAELVRELMEAIGPSGFAMVDQAEGR